MSNATEQLETVRAVVDGRLLEKADRLFTGEPKGRVIEMLQNARRAGATEVSIATVPSLGGCLGKVIIRDNGQGIEDFATVLSMGSRGWDDATEISEDPAGVGFFSLAPRRLSIRSRRRMIAIDAPRQWMGAEIQIQMDPEPIRQGTVIEFEADKDEAEFWREQAHRFCKFTGMTVTIDGREHAPESFLPDGGHVFCHSDMGVVVAVIERANLSRHEEFFNAENGYCRGLDGNLIFNFHGQLIHASYINIPSSRDTPLSYLVDMTGTPTPLRMLLPARTRVVDNEGFTRLKRCLVEDTFRYYLAIGRHKLHHRDWKRARDEFGIELPESDPVYSIGVGHSGHVEPPPLPNMTAPPLSQCYLAEDEELRGAAHLFAFHAVELESPVFPICIPNGFRDYSWAKLPEIEQVEVVRSEEILTKAWVGCGEVRCVKELRVVLHVSGDRKFESTVPMAVDSDESEVIYVTRAAQGIAPDHFWFFLGGYSDEGDSFDTQRECVCNELDAFWLDLEGPDEQARCEVMELLNKRFGRKWNDIHVSRAGRILIQSADDKTLELKPT